MPRSPVGLACPSCGVVRTTYATGAQIVRCKSCGTSFRAAQAGQPAAAAPPAATVPAAPVAAKKSGGVTVAPKTELKIPRAPKRSAAKIPKGATPAPPPASGIAPSATPPGEPVVDLPGPPAPPPPDRAQARAKASGARGGRAFYRNRFGR